MGTSGKGTANTENHYQRRVNVRAEYRMSASLYDAFFDLAE
jgi:hypothetical protein